MTSSQRKIHLFDAKGKILGRFAVSVARVLSGKGRVDYVPYRDDGDVVVVINAAQIHTSGTKEHSKVYHRYSGYPGGIRSATVREQREKDPRKLIRHAVCGMLPKNKLGHGMARRLFIYADSTYKQAIDVDHTKA